MTEEEKQKRELIKLINEYICKITSSVNMIEHVMKLLGNNVVGEYDDRKPYNWISIAETAVDKGKFDEAKFKLEEALLKRI